MKAVIMAGGKGTRIQQIRNDIPKPMLSVLGKPILQYQIEYLERYGITDIIMIIGYLGSVIQDYFGNGSRWNVNIRYIVEKEPLGTAGAFFYLKEMIVEDFVLLLGDLILDIDYNRFIEFHREHSADITLFSHPSSHPYDSDVLVVDKDRRVIKFLLKNEKREEYYHNLVNAGVYCINYKVLNSITELKKRDLEQEVIVRQIRYGSVYAYKSTEYVKDMGTPERWRMVSEDMRNGLVERRNLKNKQKAIFLDRDGTVNKQKGYIKSVDEFELLPQVAEAVRNINHSMYLAIIITNQPVVARGECDISELERIHMKMEMELSKDGGYIDDIFYCPHHPDSGFEGEVLDFKISCDCRKPGIAMIKKAAEKYNIDLSQSWCIGDTTIDIQTGKNAGMHTALLKTGEAGEDGKYQVTADIEADNLLEAVKKIIGFDSLIKREIN